MTSEIAPACPSCARDGARSLGTLPDVEVFAGQPTSGVLPRSGLFRCEACALVFRHPVLDPSAYNALYSKARSDCWAEDPGRSDWALVEDYLARHAGSGATVLDFGCHTGGLLQRLGERYERTGIEVNQTAAAAARERTGARVLHGLEGLLPGERFDYLTAVDTVEHFADPGIVLEALLKFLKPGGVLVVTTGDADNFLWRVAGARWWYCYYPEHLAFLSERWVRRWLQRKRLPARLARVHRFRHLRLTPLRFAAQVCLTVPYLLAPDTYARVVGAVRRGLGRDPTVYPPGTGLSRDHLFLAITWNA